MINNSEQLVGTNRLILGIHESSGGIYIWVKFPPVRMLYSSPHLEVYVSTACCMIEAE